MALKRISFITLCIWAAFWWGCVPKKVVTVPAKSGTHQYSFGEPRPLGEEGKYFARLAYDRSKGKLQIVFLDRNKNPVKLLREDRIRASLTGPDGKVREFSFWYPQPPLWYVSSYRVVGMRQPPMSNYSLQEDWLKKLSSFKLKVWIPFRDTTYIVEYVYP